jgi:effector-binding domain-containing protein
MLETPRVTERTAQPYAAIKAFVTMETLGRELPALHPEVRKWLDHAGVPVAGDPFFKFNVIDMDRELEVEVGFPVGRTIVGDDRVQTGVLPAGRYATVSYKGHPEGLLGATGALLRWGADEGLHWDVTETPAGDRWAARLEIYELEPPEDMALWTTELAFRLADS